MRRQRSTKIIATLGPASSSTEMIQALFLAGVDVFRLNFSHGTHEDHRQRIDQIRELETKLNRPIAVLMDLQGPKLRVGRFAEGKVNLVPGQRFLFDRADALGDQSRVTLPHPEVYQALKPNTDLLLDDGNIRLKVIESAHDYALTEVVIGGILSDRKGVNVPGVALPISSLTDKDRRDLAFGLDAGVDWVALSFVQNPADVAEARRIVAGRAAILAKLEKPQALEHLDRILELSDAVMIARGDLGVEVPAEDVPSLQKRIIGVSRQVGKPVVVATQMLDSMVRAPAPTRAEASDVATAVYDGADAVMLSAETASGAYPREAVAIMDRIAARVEKDPLYGRILDAERSEPEATPADAITAAARQVAHTIRAAAIVTFTATGSTTMRASRERPDVPILGLTENVGTARRLAIAWGVHSVFTSDVRSFQDIVDRACEVAKAEKIARPGQRLVITAGVPFGTPGATNVLRIAWVGE